MKPIIAINVDIEKNPARDAVVQTNYFQAVQKAGGIPILLPPMPEEDLKAIFARINGLLLIGGADYDPKHYDEEPTEKLNLLSPVRDAFDLRLVRFATQLDIPILGICGGSQLLNIGLGGSLIQDIPTSVPGSNVQHSSKNGWEDGWTKHEVKLEAGSRLHKIYQCERVNVPTSHHQAVKRLGDGLKATAHADDGVVEAVELPGKPFVIGVQWHPERDYEGNNRLFAAFIEQAARTPVTSK